MEKLINSNRCIDADVCNEKFNINNLLPMSWRINNTEEEHIQWLKDNERKDFEARSTDEDISQWSGENDSQRFNNYIRSTGATHLGVYHHTAMSNCQTNTENNSDLRQSLLNDAKSVYPFLTWK